MINIRKIVLLSALLMSASSITAPAHAMSDDGEGLSAPRVVHAHIPIILTQDVISELKKHGSFFIATEEWVLQNPEQLESFESYSFPFTQQSYMDNTGLLNYYFEEPRASRYPNPDYDPARPVETGPEWFDELYYMEYAKLIFKKQNPASAKPLAVAPIVEEKEVESGAASSGTNSSV